LRLATFRRPQRRTTSASTSQSGTTSMSEVSLFMACICWFACVICRFTAVSSRPRERKLISSLFRPARVDFSARMSVESSREFTLPRSSWSGANISRSSGAAGQRNRSACCTGRMQRAQDSGRIGGVAVEEASSGPSSSISSRCFAARLALAKGRRLFSKTK